MLSNRRNIHYRRQGNQPRQTLRATGAVVMPLGMVMACVLVFIHTRMRVAGRLLAISHVMAHLTGHVLGRGRIMARQTLGQRRNAGAQRQTQHQQKVDKGTGHHCC